MAYEDYTSGDWTETDTGGIYSVTTNKVEVTGYDFPGGGSRLTKDGGASHFGTTSTHQFEITFDNLGEIQPFYIYILGDTVGDSFDLSGDEIDIYINEGDGNYTLILELFDESTSDESITLATGTKYYIEVIRTATPLTTVKIRTGSHTGTLIDTISITDGGDSYRYLYQAQELRFF